MGDESLKGANRMFAGFLRYFGEKPIEISDERDPYDVFIDHFGGRSFGGGELKVIERTDIPLYKDAIMGICFKFSGDDFRPFAYNWLGQIFLIDDRENRGCVLIMRIDTVTTAYTDMGFLEYLNDELPENPERSLHVTQYGEWVASHGPVGPGECVGYKAVLPGRRRLPGQHGGHRHGCLLDYDRPAVARLPGAARGHQDWQRQLRVGRASPGRNKACENRNLGGAAGVFLASDGEMAKPDDCCAPSPFRWWRIVRR